MSKNTNTKPKSFKSGYARDIMPERMEADEKAGLTVPVANEKGAQAGIIPPAQRQYRAKYKAVSLREAEINMSKRIRGEMAPIKGGIDDPAMNFPDPKRGRAKTIGKTEFDPLGDVADPQPGDLAAEEQSLGRQYIGQTAPAVSIPSVSAPALTSAPAAVTYTQETPEQVYLRQRHRVTLEMSDGTMAMACVDVKASAYSVTILLPLADGSSIFTPRPGSEVTVIKGENRWNCYYPGAQFELPELALLGLVFIKADEK